MSSESQGQSNDLDPSPDSSESTQPPTPTSTPSKKKLLEFIPRMAPYWYEIGLQLLDDKQEPQLDVIGLNCSNDYKQCCLKMLWYWLKTNPKASWQQLISSLRSPVLELNTVAASIEAMFTEQQDINQQQLLKKEETVISVESVDITQFKSIRAAFIHLTSNISKLLQNGDFYAIRRSCIEQIHTPSGAQLSPDMVKDIKTAKNLNVLLDTLADSPYWSWIDLRLLEAMVVASGSSAANNLLTSYQSNVFSMKLLEVLPSVPSVEVKDEYYSKIVSKIDKNIEEITVSDLLKFRSQLETVIMDIKTGTCALAHIEEGCIEIQWLIPTHCIDRAFKSACLKRDKFHTLHLQVLQIRTYKIYSPSVLHLFSSTIVESQLPSSASTCKDLIDHFSYYLTTEMDSDVIVDHMLSHQLLNDQEVHSIMSAASLYQKNCLVLEKIRQMDTKCLVSFCEILQLFDYQKHIASVLLNALASFGFTGSVVVSQSAHIEGVPSIIPSQPVLPASIKLSDISRKRSAHSDKPVGKKYFKSSAVGQKLLKASAVEVEFLDMKMQVEQLVKTSSSEKVFGQCKSLMASHEPDIALFSDKQLSGLKECNLVPEILQRLSPYFKWSNHSVLHALVKACGNPEAEMLLHQFDSQVDSSLPITEYPIPQPIPSMAPYDSSSQTILAVKFDTELSTLSLQQVTELQFLIQKGLKITEHCLQLTAAEKSSAILYWIIPKCISNLITKLIHHSSLYDRRIKEICVYPGTLFISANSLHLGSLSFLGSINHLLPKDKNELLSVQLNHLEQLPKTMSELYLEFTQRELTMEDMEGKKEEIKEIMVTTKRDEQSEVVSSEVTKPATSEDMKAILKHMRFQNEGLQMQLKESKTHEKFLQQEVTKAKEKYADLNQMYEKLKPFFNFKEVENQLDVMQRNIINVKHAFRTIDVLKIKCNEELADDATKNLDKQEEALVNYLNMFNKDLSSFELADDATKNLDKQEEALVNYLNMFNKDLSSFEKWLKIIHTDRIAVEQKMNKLQEENLADITQLRHESSEMATRMKIKELENIKLKEDSKKFAKQYIQKKVEDQASTSLSNEQLTLHNLIGSGQYGEVHKVNYNRKWFACKKIHQTILSNYSAKQPDQMEKLTTEITKLLQSVKHPNVEKYEAVLRRSPNFLLLSELLFENLENFITRYKEKIQVYLQVNICSDMASGLQYLHSAGIMHKNLHSRNVLMTHELQAKLADFICPQVLSVYDAVNTTTNKAILAPEVTSNLLHTYSSDIYSLGVLFFQTVTTHLPINMDNLSEEKHAMASKVPRHHPLHMVIQSCLNTNELTRPSINEVRNEAVVKAKETPQYILSLDLYGQKESLEFGHSLQSKRYKLHWTSCTKLPTAMHGAHATVINSTLYITGGWCPNDERNVYNVYKYEFDKDQWSVLPPLQQYFGVPVSINDQLTIISGRSSTPPHKTINWVVTFIDNIWENIYPNLSVARNVPAVVPYHQYVIVAGGKGDDDNLLDSIEVFNITTSHWIIINTHLPQPMWYISATMCADSIIIVGYHGADSKRYNGTYMIAVDDIISEHQQSLTSSADNDNTQWRELADAPFWTTALVPNTSPPVIIGGSDQQDKTFNDITIYDDSSNEWKKISTIPINCAFTTVAVINQSIIILGGCNDTKNNDTCNATALSDVNIGQLVLSD